MLRFCAVQLHPRALVSGVVAEQQTAINNEEAQRMIRWASSLDQLVSRERSQRTLQLRA